jgi:hypothetical protein
MSLLLPLIARYPHPRDERIHFDEKTHTYTVDGKRVSRSVSGVAGKFFEPFNGASIVENNFEKWSSDPSSKYYPIIELCEKDKTRVKDAITKGWNTLGKIASTCGTALHFAIECELNGISSSPPFQSPSSIISSRQSEKNFGLNEAIVKVFGKDVALEIASPKSCIQATNISEDFARWKQWRKSDRGASLTPIRTEWSVFYEEYDIAGQIDALFVRNNEEDGTRHYTIVDWKRCGKLEKEAFGGRCGFPPFRHLPDTNLSKYQIQISIYAWILKHKYGIVPKEAVIVQIHESAGPDGFHEEVVSILEDELIEKALANTR